MCRRLLQFAWLLLAIPAWAGTHYTIPLNESLLTDDGGLQLLSAAVAPREYYCAADSITITPPSDNLSEGLSVLVNTVAGTQADAGNWYRVYRATSSGGPYTLIADCITLGNYLDTAVQSGRTYYYRVTAMLSGVESAPFDQATISVPVFDVLATVHGHAVGISTPLTTSDIAAAIHGYRSVPSESLTTSDALARTVGWKQRLSEMLSTSAGVAAVDPHHVNLAEDQTTADIVAGGQVLTRGISDNLSTWATLGDVQGSSGGPTGPPQAGIYLLGDQGMAAAGSCGFTLQVTGGNFTPQSIVNWNGGTRQTTYLNARILRVAITSEDLSVGGSFPITVTNSPGNTGQAKLFSVVSAAPTIAGTYALGGTLVVDGTNFVPRNTVVLWNGTALPTSWFSPTRVQARLPAGVHGIGGNTVTVGNSGCQSD